MESKIKFLPSNDIKDSLLGECSFSQKLVVVVDSTGLEVVTDCEVQ